MYVRAGTTGERNLWTGASRRALVRYMHLIGTRACMSMIMLARGSCPRIRAPSARSQTSYPPQMASDGREGPPTRPLLIYHVSRACMRFAAQGSWAV